MYSLSQVKGILQEKQTESKKLETKLRHSKEEIDIAQQEISQEVMFTVHLDYLFLFLQFHGVVVSLLDFESLDLCLNPTWAVIPAVNPSQRFG